MPINSETPDSRVEPPKTLETLRQRGGIISTVNEVYSLMAGVAQDLGAQPQRNNAQEKQVIDFEIVREGRKLLTGADLPLTEEQPTDRFINEVQDRSTGKTFRIKEGIPAEPFKEFLTTEIRDLEIRIQASQNDPEGQELLIRLLEKRQGQLGVIEKNSSPYQPGSDQERAARVEQEAYWIYNNPRRRTFSENNDWYKGESVVDGREFINLPPSARPNPFADVDSNISSARPNPFADVDSNIARSRRMPNPDGSVDLDMPDKDRADGSDGSRTPDSLDKTRRRMPNPDGSVDLDMPDKDPSLSENGESRVPDTADSTSERPNPFADVDSNISSARPNPFADVDSNISSARPNPFADVDSNISSRTTERTERTDVESRRRRLRGLPPLLIPIIAAVALALCTRDTLDRGRDQNITSSSPGVESPAQDLPPTSPDLSGPFISPPNNEKPKVNLAGHVYDNQPDASGSYGSLYGHGLYELAKVVDPTILEDQMASGKPVSSDDPRIAKAIEDFKNDNPEEFEDIMGEYKQGVVDNNPPGTIEGDDAIIRPQFNSSPMRDVYNKIMPKQKSGA